MSKEGNLSIETPMKGLHFPPPDDEIFIELVAREIRAADARAKEAFSIRPGFGRSGNKHRRSWTKEQIVKLIQKFHKEHGRLPTTNDWRWASKTYPSTVTVQRLFGSWAKGIAAAGFEPKLRGQQRTHCVGCGISIDQYREDCKKCQFRLYQRERRARLDGRS